MICVYSNDGQERNSQNEETKTKQMPDILGTASFQSTTLPIEVELEATSQQLSKDLSEFQLPESRSRRLLELRLLDYYKDYVANPLPDFTKSNVVTAWSSQVPQLALKHDNVQYMMFCLAACQLFRSEPDSIELLNAQRIYLALAMREQQKAIARLSLETCDSVCFTAMLLLITSVARLWKRPMEPYVPPVECLRLGNGVGAVFETAKVMLKDCKDAKMWLFINAPPVFDTDEIFSRENQIPFQKLLNHDIQPWDPDYHEAYEKAVAYLGYLHKAVQDNDPVYILGRKIISFSIFVPKRFIDFVEEQRPRALVIIAYYFGFMTRAKSLWWAVETPENEIWAIQRVLPSVWQEHMRWPLTMTGQTVV